MRGKARQGDRHGVRPAEPRRVDLGPRDGRAARGEAVALHLYREGMCDLADEYVASKGLDDVVEMEIDETDVVDGRAEGADGAEPSGSERPSSEPPSDPVSEAAVEAAAERRKLRPLWDELRRITRAVSDDHDLDVVSDWIRTNRDARSSPPRCRRQVARPRG